jgi:hypothetical protein
MLIEDDADAYSSEHASDFKDKVEFASDEPQDEQQLRRRRKKRDEELKESDLDSDDGDDEADDVFMDELENESVSEGSEEKRRKKENRGKGRNLAKSADLGDEELEDQNTVFIDNLPSDEFSIKRMINEAKQLIQQYECKFFEEEDSEREENLKSITNVARHE